MTVPPPPSEPARPDGDDLPENLAVVGRYSRVARAHEHGLVILAMGIPYWLMPLPEGGFALCVERDHAAAVLEQLAKSNRENRYWPPRQELLPSGKGPTSSVLLYLILIWGFFFIQNGELLRRGSASEAAIAQGEWWRAVTALTLHGDWAHLVGNSGGGLLFFALLFRLIGPGLGSISILVAGACGNLLNAWGYLGTGHDSIGASTAVFGALGILVGFRMIRQYQLTRFTWPRDLWVPVAAGVILLGLLGAGGERTDVLAHIWGFAAGILTGSLVSASRVDEWLQVRPTIDRILGWTALLLVMGAWGLALR